MSDIVACCNCNRGNLNKHNEDEVPLMFNVGNGPKYVCSICYPTYKVQFEPQVFNRVNRRSPTSSVKE